MSDLVADLRTVTKALVMAEVLVGGQACPAHYVTEQAADEIDALRAENERLRADAERYRWLRSSRRPYNSLADSPQRISVWRMSSHGAGAISLYEERLDAAIDAALAAKGNEHE